MSRRAISAAWLVLTLTAAGPLAAQRPVDFARFDRFVRRTMADWQVPGVAVGIVRNDTVVFARGFGVREVGRPDTVDARTIFGNGSTTKAFTAAVLASLVDEGRLGWDDRVIDHLPDFRLADPWATREVTVRDLLAHRTGVVAGTYQLLEYWGSRTSRDELVRRLRYEPIATSLRERHIYHNITYTAAGSVAEAITGKSWEALLRERILAPLGMRSSSPILADVVRETNLATPHGHSGGRVVPVDWLDLANIGPAGSLNSNVDDMLRWLRMLLSGGRFEGRQVLSPAAVRAMFEPAIPIPSPGATAPDFTSYALGWRVELSHGRKVVTHTGSAQGFQAFMGLVPEERLGVVIFGNRHLRRYPPALFRDLLDRFFGPPDAPDRSAELLAQVEAAEARVTAAEAALRGRRIPGTSPSLPLASYAGTYEIDLLDPSEVRVENGGLVWEVSPAFIGELEHWHHDVFRVARWRSPLWEGMSGLFPFVSFRLEPSGLVAMEVDGVGRLRRR